MTYFELSYYLRCNFITEKYYLLYCIFLSHKENIIKSEKATYIIIIIIRVILTSSRNVSELRHLIFTELNSVFLLKATCRPGTCGAQIESDRNGRSTVQCRG